MTKTFPRNKTHNQAASSVTHNWQAFNNTYPRTHQKSPHTYDSRTNTPYWRVLTDPKLYDGPRSKTQVILNSFYDYQKSELWELVLNLKHPVKRRTHPVTYPEGIKWANNPRYAGNRTDSNNRYHKNRNTHHQRPRTTRKQTSLEQNISRRQATTSRPQTTHTQHRPAHTPRTLTIRTKHSSAKPRTRRQATTSRQQTTQVRRRHSVTQISPPRKSRKKWFKNLLSKWFKKNNLQNNITFHYNPRPSANTNLTPTAPPRPSAPPLMPTPTAPPRPSAPPLIPTPPAPPRPSAPPLIQTQTNTSSETMKLVEINGTLTEVVNSSLPRNIIDQLLEWLSPEWIGTAQDMFSSICKKLETYFLEPVNNWLGRPTTRGQEALSRRTLRDNLSNEIQASLADLELAPEAHLKVVQNMIEKDHPDYKHITTLRLKHREWPDIPSSHFHGLTHHATGIPQAGNILKHGPKPGHRNAHSGPGFYTVPTISSEIVEEYGIGNDGSDLGFAIIHYAHYDIGNSTNQYIRKLKDRLGTRAKTDFIITNDNNSILVPWAITLHNKTEAEQVSAKAIISSALSNSKATFQDHFPIALIETLPSTEYKSQTTAHIISLWKTSQGNFDEFLRTVGELPQSQFRTVMQALHKLKLTKQDTELIKKTEAFYYSFGQCTFV